MCGRYRIDDDGDSGELEAIVEEINRRYPGEAVKTSGEIFPTDTAPVIANNRRLSPAPFAMQWGFGMPDGRRVINARSETASSKPLFQDGMRQRRCAIPATSYYEWERASGRKTKYAIRPASCPLFYLAGLYRLEAGKPVFAVLTREPADSIAFIHNRMPVLLAPDLARDWLNPAFSARDLLAHSLLDVGCRAEPQPAPEVEQLSMLFPEV